MEDLSQAPTISCLLLLAQAVKPLEQPCKTSCVSPGSEAEASQDSAQVHTGIQQTEAAAPGHPPLLGGLKSDRWGLETNLLEPALPLFECLQWIIL